MMPTPPVPVDSYQVAVDGGHVYVECHGDGPPLVLIHGWSLDRRNFDPQVTALGDRFRIIAYDRRGFGRSDAPPDMHLELDDIDRILDTLEVDSAHFAGVSQGGRIALRYAVTRPERLRSLVLQGAAIDGLAVDDSGDERIPLDEYVALAQNGRVEEIRHRWLRHPAMTLAGGDAKIDALLRSIVNDYEARDLVDYKPESYAFPIDPLQAITAFDKPILVITGRRETKTRREHARRLVEEAPHAREEIFEFSGHLASIEESDRFNEALASFCLAAEGLRDASA